MSCGAGKNPEIAQMSNSPSESDERAAAAPPTVNRRPTDALEFRWPWRPYQQRVLDAIDRHLSDDRLHVVAAPGAGKTVLGLEVFRRLGEPAVVFSPTRVIRDQWLERLSDFVPENGLRPDWTSKTIDAPAFLTSLTYQSLHSFNKRGNKRIADVEDDEPDSESDEESVEGGSAKAPRKAELNAAAAVFNKAGVKTIILDEAHHLRAAWWRALHALVEQIDDVIVVSLTGTPPYDVAPHEWHRYELLCGPIDEEISIPELVYSETLAPHQDFLWAVEPDEEEQDDFETRAETATAMFHEILADDRLTQELLKHRWMSGSVDIADVLTAPELAFAMLCLIKAQGQPPPQALTHALGIVNADIPPIDKRHVERVLASYLFDEQSWSADEETQEHRQSLARRLRSKNLLVRRQLCLSRNPRSERALGLSSSKIDACLQIHRLERAARGETLRLAILTDYIRKGVEDELGAWPIFLRLTSDANGNARDVVLLTGSLIVVHLDCVEYLQESGQLTNDMFQSQAPAARPGFVQLKMRGGSNRFVRLLSDLLRAGLVHTVVGTRALLGEGWDAPEITSLILATSVGSFVSTNQLRGRAIRRSKLDPTKLASIWHLVCVDYNAPEGMSDVARLEQRFDTFVGAYNDRDRIGSGLDRLNLPRLNYVVDLQAFNELSARRLAKLESIRDAWQRDPDERANAAVVPVVRLVDRERALAQPEPPSLRGFYVQHVKSSIRIGGVSFGSVLLSAGAKLALGGSNGAMLHLTLLGLGLGAAAMLGIKLFNHLGGMIKHIPSGGTMLRMCLAIRDALAESRLLECDAGSLAVAVKQDEDGIWSATVTGGNIHDRSILADAIAEMLNPVADQRYLVTRGLNPANRPEDIHAIPTELARKPASRQIFLKHWIKQVGMSSMIDTQLSGGRPILLRIKSYNMMGKFAHSVHRSDRWE